MSKYRVTIDFDIVCSATPTMVQGSTKGVIENVVCEMKPGNASIVIAATGENAGCIQSMKNLHFDRMLLLDAIETIKKEG